MNRRQFHSIFGLGALAWATPTLNNTAPAKRLLKPKHLAKGQQVGLITPASYISDDKLQKGVTQLESMGLKVQLGKHVRQAYGSMAGTDAERMADFHRMFADPNIDAVWCARGGYGAARMLPAVDFKLIRRNPKIFVGYSDITALHCAIQRHSGLVTFHGPVGSSEYPDYTEEQLRKVLFAPSKRNTIPLVAKANAMRGETEPAYAYRVLRPGKATGGLTGGNLSLLASAAGTSFAPRIKGRILFIEDIGEKPYRVDRMLTTLRQAWPLEEAAALVLGIFNDCEAKAGSRSLSLQQTITDRLGDLNIPIVYGASFGHIDHMCTLPMGIRATLDTDDRTLSLLESPVV